MKYFSVSKRLLTGTGSPGCIGSLFGFSGSSVAGSSVGGGCRLLASPSGGIAYEGGEEFGVVWGVEGRVAAGWA